MYIHKIKISACIALLLLTPIILSSCQSKNSPRPVLNFTELYEAGNLNKLTLTVYIARPVLTTIPWSIDTLTKGTFGSDDLVSRYIIRNVDFTEHVDLLIQLDSVCLTPPDQGTPRIDARFHYIFEASGRAFTVSGWGHINGYSSIFVNGVEVRDIPIFYEVVIPFLPEHVVEQLERRIERMVNIS